MSYEDLQLDLMDIGQHGSFMDDLAYIKRMNPTDPHPAAMFQYLLSTANIMSKNGMVDKYAFIGGYAVLGHLMKTFGEHIVRNWRGSDDLDIVARDQGVSSIIEGNFAAAERRRSRHLRNKYSLEVADPGIDVPCEIDFYVPTENGSLIHIEQSKLDDDFWRRSVVITPYGIPFRVPSITDMLRLKLNVYTSNGMPRRKDRKDISDLALVSHHENADPSHLDANLTDTERERLREVLRNPEATTFESGFDRYLQRFTKRSR
jgi:hypothetical protein